MRQLATTDLNMVLRRLPSDVRKLMRQDRIFLAGGFIREVIAGHSVNDIDLFASSEEQLADLASGLYRVRIEHPGVRLHSTKFAHTVICSGKMPVQFISKWLYTDPEKLLSELDFTICQAVVWYEGDEYKSLCADDFYGDLAARRLVYTFPERAEAAGGSLMRVRKFLARGYNIQVHSLAGVVARLVGGVDEGRLNGLLSEGKSREQARHIVLKSLLHEVDPLLIIDGSEPREEEVE